MMARPCRPCPPHPSPARRGSALRPRSLALLLLGTLLGAQSACSRGTPAATTQSASPVPASTAAAAATGATPAQAQSIYDYEAIPFRGKAPKSLKAYAGDVLLVVNIASHCGFTSQMKPLAELEKRYAGKRFHVLGFLSNDFGQQAGTDEEVTECNLKHGVGFDEFAVVGVKSGANQAPLFGWLTSRPGLDGEVRWNFSKWLVSREGQLVERWGSMSSPDSSGMIEAIEAQLAR